MPRSWIVSVLLLAVVASTSACPGSSDCPLRPDQGGGGRSVLLKGRVVDFETCLTTAGCQGVAGVRVALFHNSAVFSSPTSDSGAFALSGVPDGARLFLLVTDASGAGQFLPALQAEPVTTQGKDLFGVEIYALQRAGGLYAGISSEAMVDVQSDALYLGQVLSVQGGKMKAIPDVTIRSVPSAKISYVNCIPTFQQCAGQQTLFSSRSSTGVFGEFVLVSTTGPADHAVWGTSSTQSFNINMAPLGKGYLTIGLHRSQGAAPPPPPQDAAPPPPHDGGP